MKKKNQILDSKYWNMTLKEIKEDLEKKSIKELTLSDIFLYETITKEKLI